MIRRNFLSFCVALVPSLSIKPKGQGDIAIFTSDHIPEINKYLSLGWRLKEIRTINLGGRKTVLTLVK